MFPKTLPVALRPAAAMFIAAAICCAPAWGDVFVLKGGGRIEGKLLNGDESPRQTFVIQTPQGKITLARTQVAQVIAKTPAQLEYDALLPKVGADAESQWKLAEWCRKQDGFDEQRGVHLEQVIAAEPNHEGARRALGFARIDGKWVKPDDHMDALGFVRHGGAWRTQQEADLERTRKEQDQAVKDWKVQIRRWIGWLKRRPAEALANFREIRDPLAGPALADLLKEDADRNNRLLYIEVIGRLPPGSGTGALINVALHDADERVRDAALQVLSAQQPVGAANAFIKALSDKDNQQVHRAGLGLAALKDRETVLPLIDALTTQHRTVIRSGSSGGIGASFGSGGNSFSAGGQTKVFDRQIENAAVLDALLALSDGANFRYDKRAWRNWYAEQQTPRVVNLRRDD